MNKDADFYQNVLRVLLILYFFSEEYNNDKHSKYVKVFYSETKIQKIDFLIRYPSYLCDELMNLVERNNSLKVEVYSEVNKILVSNEPQIRTKDMLKFFFGAFDRLDEFISFLKAYGFVDFKSKRRTDFRVHQKEYYLTGFAVEKIENGLRVIPDLSWYFERCSLIKKYFGDLSGTQLKEMQYEHPEYRSAAWNEKIKDIETRVRVRFFQSNKIEV